jgi:hypothetical protein
MTWNTNNAAATLTVMQAICKDEHRHTPLYLRPVAGTASARLPHGCGTGLTAAMNAAVAGISVVALG